jgi:hypothetical protein
VLFWYFGALIWLTVEETILIGVSELIPKYSGGRQEKREVEKESGDL